MVKKELDKTILTCLKNAESHAKVGLMYERYGYNYKVWDLLKINKAKQKLQNENEKQSK